MDPFLVLNVGLDASDAEVRAAYQALLRQIYPQKPVRVAILWTSVPQLMWLDEAVENTAWNGAVAA